MLEESKYRGRDGGKEVREEGRERKMKVYRARERKKNKQRQTGKEKKGGRNV